MKTLIYALADPRDDVIRYVGRTTDPYGRMYRHLRDGREHGTPKQRWVWELRQLRLKPRMIVLDCADPSEASAVEMTWIAAHASESLFNVLGRSTRKSRVDPIPTVELVKVWAIIGGRQITREIPAAALEPGPCAP